MPALLEIDDVSKTFRGEDGSEVQALLPTKLAVEEGRFVSVIGPSGCGKSTLFNIIGGLMDSDSGEVRVDGEPVAGTHKDIGMVFQEESTFPWRAVLSNMAFPLEVAGLGRRARGARAPLHPAGGAARIRTPLAESSPTCFSATTFPACTRRSSSSSWSVCSSLPRSRSWNDGSDRRDNRVSGCSRKAAGERPQRSAVGPAGFTKPSYRPSRAYSTRSGRSAHPACTAI